MLSLWFGFSRTVDRRAYALSGLGLMALKYLLDAALVYAGTGKLYPLTVFFDPLLSDKQRLLSPAPEWMLTALVLVALPFAWVGASMSLRRAVDAGLSPWLGLLFFVPGVNFVVMLVLAALPSRPHPAAPQRRLDQDHRFRSALIGVSGGVALALTMTGLSVYALGDYGGTLFFLSPVLMGVIASFAHNRGHLRSVRETVLVAVATVAIAGGLILLFALEGLVCIAMATPPALVLALLGAMLGRAMASWGKGTGGGALITSVLVLPLIAASEGTLRQPELHEVVTTLEIDAPPSVVWSNVVAFAPLPAPTEWIFASGIAYPTGATIVGTGVGAVRHCQFSTGPFVEPITVWDEPRRLAFDVASMPPPMEEWSPYGAIDAPHLDGYFASQRGEFRLVPLDGGTRTRLEGSTFYTMDIAPTGYWRVWAEYLLHRIHARVLRHIAAESTRVPR